MKNLRQMLLAASVLVIATASHAQSVRGNADVNVNPSAPGSPTVTVSPNATTSGAADPYVQKRASDKVSKDEYKAEKRAAKRKMKEEKKAAKSEYKNDKRESAQVRKEALAAPATPATSAAPSGSVGASGGMTTGSSAVPPGQGASPNTPAPVVPNSAR